MKSRPIGKSQPNAEVRPLPSGSHPKFGSTFTNHMVMIRWEVEGGWSEIEVCPMQALSLHPATAVLHYAQEIFEGLKAYRQVDGSVGLFRIRDHAVRFGTSARRMAMPELPVELFERACLDLVTADMVELGKCPGDGLYLRPMLISTTPELGAGRASGEYQFIAIASPTPTLDTANDAISVWATTDYVRAAAGGTGAVKAGANYAQGMLGQVQAREHGCQQVVWLDAAEKSYVEELGAMNLFFVFGEGDDCEIVTPPLSDTILPGITRRSVLAIGDDLGLAVSERRVSLADWQQLCSESKITETFATGTAAGLTPVRKVKSMSGEWTVGTSYPITSRIADHLNAIQSGARDDQHEWMQHL